MWRGAIVMRDAAAAAAAAAAELQLTTRELIHSYTFDACARACVCVLINHSTSHALTAACQHAVIIDAFV